MLDGRRAASPRDRARSRATTPTLVERGVSGYSLDQCWDDYRMSLLQMCTAVVIVSDLQGGNERGDELLDNLLLRPVDRRHRTSTSTSCSPASSPVEVVSDTTSTGRRQNPADEVVPDTTSTSWGSLRSAHGQAEPVRRRGPLHDARRAQADGLRSSRRTRGDQGVPRGGASVARRARTPRCGSGWSSPTQRRRPPSPSCTSRAGRSTSTWTAPPTTSSATTPTRPPSRNGWSTRPPTWPRTSRRSRRWSSRSCR